jgi:serine/threonine protein kinase
MYMSPEVLNRETHDPRAADIWSLGVCFYHMLVGDSPWSSVESLDELMDLVVFETSVQFPPFLSQEVQDLLGAILVHQPSRRLSLQEIRQRVSKLF